MVAVHRAISASGGKQFEVRGRFLSHVAQLEWLTRLIVAGYLSGTDETEARFRILHDDLLRHANFSSLAKVFTSIINDQPDDVRETWKWLPKHLRDLAAKRNAIAHMAAPWSQEVSPLSDLDGLVRLLLKVDAGVADFGAFQSAGRPESEYDDHAREMAPSIVEQLRGL